MPADAPLLTSQEVARLLRVHPKHVYRLLARGLPARRAGGKWLFARDEVLAWSQRQGSNVPSPAAPQGDGVVPPLLAANGDLVVELLLAQAQAGAGPLVGFVQADRTSGLELLEAGRVLAAGAHGHEARSGSGHVWLHLVDREVGLVTRRRRVPSLAELRRLRLASRPSTAGVRDYFDAALRQAGLTPARVHRTALLLGSHREVVLAVARGEADVGVASRAWAARLGLPFTTLAVEPYGVVVRGRDLGAPEVVRLCEVAQTSTFRAHLAAIPGYAATRTGAVRFSAADGA
jgi:putative molybdopterin biosynthesis protein